MRHLSKFLPVLWAAIVIATACSTRQRIRAETTLAEALVSDEQSRQIGDRVHSELDTRGLRYVQDEAIVGYVSDISGRIFAFARRDRPGMDYHVHVIADPDTVNAFATPGGHIYVYSGLLVAADDEAEVAGVLAHEAGHVVGRHAERSMVNAYGLKAVAAMALGRNPSLIRELATSIAATGILRAHGRGEEIEADAYGARYSSRTSYDPRAMISFLEKLGAGESRAPAPLAWLRTHPMARDRIDNLKRYIRENRLNGTVRNEARHQEIRRRLRSAPPRA